jgi:hypothetical protein
MLKIIDLGCDQHQLRQLTITSAEAEWMSDLLENLPRQGELHTFICEHGQTHHINLQMRALKVA